VCTYLVFNLINHHLYIATAGSYIAQFFVLNLIKQAIDIKALLKVVNISIVGTLGSA